jgi:hypothetical protein
MVNQFTYKGKIQEEFLRKRRSVIKARTAPKIKHKTHRTNYIKKALV